MRRLFILILALLSLAPTVHADFFTDTVTNADVELDQIDQVTLNYVKFQSARENDRYANAVQFIEAVKNEAHNRYADGLIPYYRMNDIVIALDSLAYNLNKHFYYYKRYEQTKRDTYKTASDDYFSDARQGYEKLRAILKKSAK